MPDPDRPEILQRRAIELEWPGYPLFLRAIVGTPFAFTAVPQSQTRLEWVGDLEGAVISPDTLRLTVTYSAPGPKELLIYEVGDAGRSSLPAVEVRFRVVPPYPDLEPFPVITTLGEPEDIPDRTFLVFAGREADDPFIKAARRYHHLWKLEVVKVKSLQEVIEHLAEKGERRIRIVSHADQEGLFTPMFTGSSSESSVAIDTLRGFALSDAKGLSALIGDFSNPRQLLSRGGTLRGTLIRRLRESAPEVLRPFGLEVTADNITDNLDEFMRRCVDLAAAESLDSNKAVKVLVRALRKLLDLLAIDIKNETGANSGQVNARQVAALRREIRKVVKREALYRMDPLDSSRWGEDQIKNVNAALRALENGFRKNLQRAQRWSREKHTYVDVRGCNVGFDDGELLSAIAAFFGTEPQRVSGPSWFQTFQASALVQELFDDDPDGTRQAAVDPDVKAAVEHWAEMTGIAAVATRRAQTSGNRMPPWEALSAYEKLDIYLTHARASCANG